MGYVDRFDKNCAMFRLRFKRCIRRYHRAIFMWYLSLVVNNIIVLFDSLFTNADELRRSKEASNIGYKHWFQNQMGNRLINDDMCLARAKTKNRSDHQFLSNRDRQMSQTSLSQSASRRTTTSSVSTAIYFCSPPMSASNSPTPAQATSSTIQE